jgi:hypothetical protein
MNRHSCAVIGAVSLAWLSASAAHAAIFSLTLQNQWATESLSFSQANPPTFSSSPLNPQATNTVSGQLITSPAFFSGTGTSFEYSEMRSTLTGAASVSTGPGLFAQPPVPAQFNNLDVWMEVSRIDIGGGQALREARFRGNVLQFLPGSVYTRYFFDARISNLSQADYQMFAGFVAAENPTAYLDAFTSRTSNSSVRWDYFFTSPDPQQSFTYLLDGTLAGIEYQIVPAPGAAALLALGLAGRRRRN